MKKTKQYFIFVNPLSISRVQQIRVPRIFIFLFCLGLCVGMAGMTRLMWFGTSYGWAKIGFYHERCENERLMVKVDFLDKFLLREKLKLNVLVAFEDVTRLVYGMKSISNDVRMAGIGGTPSPEEKTDDILSNPQLIKSAALQESLSTLLRRVQLQNTTFGQMEEHVEQQYRYWTQNPSIRPAPGQVTSIFGYRPDPISGIINFHDGMDIANEPGTPIVAPADGIVKDAGVLQNFGNAVVILHPESGVETIYGHLQKYTVRAEQRVKRGELIGLLGNSGKSTGPHLHYEVRKNGRAISPVPFILPTDQATD
jgi:hypothetical protein